MKTEIFPDIIKEEQELLEKAEEKYGDFFRNTYGFIVLLQDFIKSSNPEGWIFVMFLSQVRKHSFLAFLSTLRLHHMQAMLDLRQTLEAAANGAYAIANPTEKDFVTIDSNGIADAPQSLGVKRYKWLDTNYPISSQFIKNMKDSINSSAAHSGMIYGFLNFKLEKVEKAGFHTPFFDMEDDYLVKTSLWQIGNILLGLMDLFYGVNQNHPQVIFKDSFVKELKELETGNNALKTEMMKHPRFLKSAGLLNAK